MIVATKADEYDDQRRASRVASDAQQLSRTDMARWGAELAAKLKYSRVGLWSRQHGVNRQLSARLRVDAIQERSAGSNASGRASSIKLPVRAPCRAADLLNPAIAPAAPFLRARPAPVHAADPHHRWRHACRTARWRRAPRGQSPSSMARGPRATPSPAPWASPLIKARAARWRRPSCRRPSVATKSASACASSWSCGRGNRSGASKTARQGPFRPVRGLLAGCRPRPSARGRREEEFKRWRR